MRARLLFASLVAGLLAIVAVHTAAQEPSQAPERKLELTFDGNGYVTLIAQNVTVADVFAQWARVGGTKITRAQELPPTQINVQFDSTPEQKLVESLVRLSKAQNPGFIAVPRLVNAPVTPSRLASISILPRSSPTSSYSGSTSQAAPIYQPNSPDDELPPVMPPVSGGPAQAPPPQPAPAARGGGPGIPVVPVGGPGTTGRSDQTPLPGRGRG